MLFNSLQFIGFFVVVYAIHIVLTHRFQNIWLLLASWFFYGFWSREFLLLMVGASALNYALGLCIHKAKDNAKKPILIAGIAFNLGILALFKYFDFFALGLRQLLERVGFQADVPSLALILPLGISFYTFHNLSYIVDVYRGRIKPTRSFVSYALYVALFPQLIAGPIARPEHLLPQIEGPRSISYDMVREGFWLILLGFYKKVVLADNMIPFTKPIFDTPGEASGPAILLGIYAFAFQIYGDFSGYSDIARGLSKMMGFELLLNFNRPEMLLIYDEVFTRQLELSRLRRQSYANLHAVLAGSYLARRQPCDFLRHAARSASLISNNGSRIRGFLKHWWQRRHSW